MLTLLKLMVGVSKLALVSLQLRCKGLDGLSIRLDLSVLALALDVEPVVLLSDGATQSLCDFFFSG